MSLQNTHNAMASGIGTMYQFLFFARRSLSLHSGENIGFERFDDVDVSSSDEGCCFYQLKHTMRCGKDGYVNMPARDADFWKTLHVWIDMSTGSVDKDDKFFGNNSFVLVTNKITENDIVKKIEQYQSGRVTFEEVKYAIDKLKSESEEKLRKKQEKSADKNKEAKDGSVLTWIKEALNFEHLHLLFKKIELVRLSIADLQNEIKDVLVNEKYLDVDAIDNCYTEFLGEMVNDWIDAGSIGESHLSYSYEAFAQRFQRTFNKYRCEKFKLERSVKTYDFNPLERTFVKQLLDIDDIRETDASDIEDYTLQMLDFDNFFQDSDRRHLINDQDKTNFKKDVMRHWRENFRKGRHPLAGEDEKAAARRVLDVTRNVRLTIGGEELDDYFSNGCYYLYSDIPSIGWLQNWERLYKS